MNVLVTATIGRTIDAFLRPQIAELQHRGHQVSVLCDAAAPIADLSPDATILPAPWQRPVRPSRLPGHLASVRRMLVAARPDVVYCHTAIAATIVRTACATMRHRPRVAYCAHGFNGADATRPVPRAASRAIERVLARFTDLLFVMNDEDERWARTAGFRRVVRLPSIGLDLGHYRAAPREVPEHRRIVVIAELIARKRVHLALEVLAHLDRRFTMVVLGDGPLHLQLADDAERLGVADRVSFAGQVADVRPFIADAWVVLSTSRQEGLARSLLEAAALGTPAAAFAARGVSEVLTAGRGVLVEGDDPRRLASALTELDASASRWSEIRDAAAQAISIHDADRIARDVGDALERLGTSAPESRVDGAGRRP